MRELCALGEPCVLVVEPVSSILEPVRSLRRVFPSYFNFAATSGWSSLLVPLFRLVRSEARGDKINLVSLPASAMDEPSRSPVQLRLYEPPEENRLREAGLSGQGLWSVAGLALGIY